MGAWLLRGATAPGRKTMDGILAHLFVAGIYAALALWSIQSARRARRFRTTGRWD